MPRATEPRDRTPAERAADHANLALLAEGLVPALVAKLNASGLGEVEVREGDWRIRVRRPTGSGAGPAPGRRPERARPTLHATDRDGRTTRDPASGDARPVASAPGPGDDDQTQAVATSPAVGVFRPVGRTGSRVSAGDRIGLVDLLGIPQDVVAPIDGTLCEFLVESGAAVEFGEPVATLEGRIASEPAVASGEG